MNEIFMYKMIFRFVLKLEIGRGEDKNGTTIVTEVNTIYGDYHVLLPILYNVLVT